MTDSPNWLNLFVFPHSKETKNGLLKTLAKDDELCFGESNDEPQTWMVVGMPLVAVEGLLKDLKGLDLGATADKVRLVLGAAVMDWESRSKTS